MTHCLTLERPEVKIHVCFGDWVTKSPLWWPVWHYLERLHRDLISFPHSKRRRLFHHKRADLWSEIKHSHLTNGCFCAHKWGTWTNVMVKRYFRRCLCHAKKYHDMILQMKHFKSTTAKKLLCFDRGFHVLVPFTSFKRTAGWLQGRMGKLSWQISGLPLPAVSPHPSCYCYCS